MIPNQVDVVEVESSGFADSFGMSIDENSLAHIMEVLTKMYSDPALAVIREYSANALDSHVKVGNKAPIEVSLPSRWNNMFVVRDYGIGMNVDYMRAVYSKYGASDKRDSNEFIGGFGIGSKAGLAYTHSFTVTAWQNGKRSRAIVSLDEAGVGKFDIVDVVDSDEPTGVEIKIAVKGDTVEFARKARDFFAFWEAGTVLIDGAEPDHKTGTPVGDNLVYNRVDRGYYRSRAESHIVVGSVPYKIDMDKIPGGERIADASIGIILRVGVGDVAIAPSREALSYTPGTIAVIENAISGLWDTIVQAELDKIQSAASFVEAHRMISSIGYPFSDDKRFKDIVYKGAKYVQRFQHQHKKLYFDWQDRGFVDDRAYVDVNHALTNTEIIVTGFTGKVLSTVLKRKMKQYAEDNNLSDDNILIVDADITEPWLADIHRVSIDVIKNVKLPAGQYVANKKVPTYDVWTKDGHKAVPTVTGKTIYYVSQVDTKQEDRWGRVSSINLAKLADLLGDVTIVTMTKNRFEKFLRENPKAKPLAPAINAEIKRLADLSSDFDATDAGIQDWNHRQFLRSVDENQILDAELVTLVKAYRANKPDPDFAAAQVLYDTAKRGTMVVQAPVRKRNRAQEVLNRYPLIEHVGSSDMDHLVLYINAVFEKENI